MSDETPARKRRSSAAPDAADDNTDPGADATAPAEAPDPTGTAPDAPGGGASPASAADLLGQAEHLIVNIQIASPNPELNRVRVLVGQARELLTAADSQPGADG